jgi:hypothetical protein
MGASTKCTAPAQLFLVCTLALVFDACCARTAAPEENSLLDKLEAMRIKEPNVVLTTLHSLGLELGEDFVILNDGEREEMLSGLGSQGISLGDRSKVRHRFGTLHAPCNGTTDAMLGYTSSFTREFHADLEDADAHSNRQTISTSPARRAQDSGGGGVSSDSIALMATAALGILSFIVQARVSSNATKKQADLDREHAERDKEQMRAGKLLERVQLQLAEFVDPATISLTFAGVSWIHICIAVGLDECIAQWQLELIAPPGTPHAKMNHTANPKTWRAIAANPLYVLYDAEIEMLQGDAAKRQLYADLVEAMLLPALTPFCDIVATKSHLAPWFKPERLDKMLPGLGQSWAAKASLINVFVDLVVWAKQFEAVLARMKAGDNSLVAPTMAFTLFPVLMTLPMMKAAVSKKELALLGASQGKNTAAGTAFMTAGSDAEANVVET